MAARALERWGEQLREWAIPEDILAAAPESPYGFPTEPFRSRAETARDRPPTATTVRALEALPQGGNVLDVGVGAGSTSIPLAGRASRITGVDGSEGMLEAFREVAEAHAARVDTVLGVWPDVAGNVEAADVVVCGHVLYNVQDLGPFVLALTNHARRLTVVELTGSHPLAWMNDLWMRFHGLERPSGPTADDAEAAVRELGLDPGRESRIVESRTQPASGFARRADAIALVRRRLCLGADRDEKLARALGDRLAERDGLWSAGPERQTLVTMWWSGDAT